MATRKYRRWFILTGTLVTVMIVGAMTLGKYQRPEPGVSLETWAYIGPDLLGSYPFDNKPIDEEACLQMRAAVSYLRQCERSMPYQPSLPCSIIAPPIEIEPPTNLDTVEQLRIEYEARKDTACETPASRRRLQLLKESQ